MKAEPTQPTLRRLRRFEIHPKRALGQNFLIDSNLLAVITRAAELGEGDVVLEIGGGVGVLSEYLAPRCAHVHVVEVDRSLEPALRDALDPHPNTSLYLADATEPRPRRAAPGADARRRQPALRHRRERDPEDRRRASRGDALGRDGPA